MEIHLGGTVILITLFKTTILCLVEKFLSLTAAPGSLKCPRPGWTGHGAAWFSQTCPCPWQGIAVGPFETRSFWDSRVCIEVGSLRYCGNSKNTNCNMVSVADMQTGEKSLHSTGNVKQRAFCMLLSASTMCGLCSHFTCTALWNPQFQILQISFCFQGLDCNLTYSKILLKCFFKAQTGDYVILTL